MCVAVWDVDGGYLPLPTRPQRYCNPALLVILSLLPSATFFQIHFRRSYSIMYAIYSSYNQNNDFELGWDDRKEIQSIYGEF